MSLINGTQIEVLNLEKIFVNYFAGTIEIFFFAAIFLFAYLGARFRMNFATFGILMVVFVVMMAGLGYTLLFALVVFLAGMIFYLIWVKTIKGT